MQNKVELKIGEIEIDDEIINYLNILKKDINIHNNYLPIKYKKHNFNGNYYYFVKICITENKYIHVKIHKDTDNNISIADPILENMKLEDNLEWF